MLKNLVISTLVQLGLFLFIPLIVFIIFFRKEYSFFEFLGIKKHGKIESNLLIKMLGINIAFIAVSIMITRKYNLGQDNIRVLSYKQTGLSIETILIILISSVMQTSFLEELVFRGFLINTLRNRLGFAVSNHIQAIIFSGLHIFAMLGFSIIEIILITGFIYILSIYFGKAMKKSGYSVFYSSISHGLMNVIAGIIFIWFNK